ncbi:hypothetical protein MPEAHAMD_6688 [Methylobacterium frigidaeris]|uniref:Uncharacterized protein n=1 Tax=Methylobacterium frigidaeris TaxID=2038277 RepID=A0AA37M817_9HYPH|nr:hypothetical protein MPEAHAMD_6688 [Methylobacterium frigidaeris]
MVERSHAWFNRARRLPVRDERRADIYEAFTLLQASIITLHQIERFCEALLASALTHSDGAALPLTASRMAAAGLVQTKGFGLSLCSAM